MATPLSMVFDILATDRASDVFKRVGDAADVSAAKQEAADSRVTASASKRAATLQELGVRTVAQQQELDGILVRQAQETAAKQEAIAKKQAEDQAATFKAGALGVAAGVGLVAAAVSVISVKMAADFQQNITKLATTAGESQANLKMVGDGILNMAGQVGLSADELSKGMYTVESAGYHGADALDVLKASAQGARQENADLGKVADAVSTILHDYHLPASQAADVTSKLVDAVSHGKTTFDELTGALHSVTPLASALHIPLADVAGSLASMTASGESAEQATQNMRNALQHLATPLPSQVNELASLGITAQDMSDKLGTRGLAGTMQDISAAIMNKMGPAGHVLMDSMNQSKTASNDLQVMLKSMPPDLQKLSQGFQDGSVPLSAYRKAVNGMGGESAAMGQQFLSLHQRSQGFNDILKAGGPAAQSYQTALQKATGTVAGMTVALMTTGENADATNASIKDIAGSTADAAGNIKGWGEVQSNFNQRLAELKDGLGAAAISLGQKLLPALTDALGWLVDHGLPAVQDFGKAFMDVVGFISNHSGVFGLLASVASGAAAAFIVWKGAIEGWSLATKAATLIQGLFNTVMDANPVMLVVIGIAALAAGVIYAYGHFKTFRDVVNNVFDFLKGAPGIVAAVAGDIGHWFAQMYNDVTGWATRAWHDVAGFFASMAKDVGGAVSGAWHVVTGFFASMWSDVTGFASRIWHDVAGFFVSMAKDIGDAVQGVLNFIGDHWRLLLFIFTGPIGLVIVLIVDFWKQISGFFDAGWKSVSGFASRMWGDVSGFFQRMWSDVTGWVSRTWSDVTGLFGKAGTEVGTQTSSMWSTVTGFFGRIWADVTGWASRLWSDVVGFFKRIAADVWTVVSDFWNREVQGWENIWHVVSGFVSNLWSDVVGFFKRIAADVWGVLVPFFDRVGKGFTDLWASVTGTASNIWHGVTGFFGSLRDDAVNIFTDIVGKVKGIWQGVQDVMAVPIRWVVDNVWDKGIVPIWNGIAGVLHEDSLKVNPFHFAEGGVVPGSHDRDDVPIYATPGEVIVPKPIVAKVGGAERLMNALGFGGGGAGGHYSLGGIVGDIGSGIGSAAGAVKDAVSSAVGDLGKLAQGALGVVATPAVHGLESLADATLGKMGGFGGDAAKMVHVLGDEFLKWVTGRDSKDQAAASAAGGNYGPAAGAPGGGVERWRPVVDQALAMLGLNQRDDNGVLALIQSESGGNPNAINLWDSNAKAGHPSRGLMQTIPSTFERWRSPSLPDNIVDPLANIYAGINYAFRTYGETMLAAGGRHASSGGYIGYETGTNYVPETGLHLLHRGEAVVPAAKNQGAPYRDQTMQVALKLDGQAVTDLLEGRLVTTLTAVTDRGAYNG